MSNRQAYHVKWLFLVALAVPAGMAAFVGKCSGTALVFTLKKFIQDPQAIVALTSLNVLFGILVAPVVAWYSDRLHTSWGRRRPLMIPGLIVLTICLVLLPQANNLVLVIIILVVYQFSMDFGFTGLWNPLYADIVPDEQRGRGMVMNRAMAMAMRMVFMLFLIGRFDMKYGGGQGGHGKGHGGGSAAMKAVHYANLTGEQVIYYSAAVLVILTILFLVIFVREPASGTAYKFKERFNLRRYLSNIFGNAQLRRLYLWVGAATLMSTKLGSLQTLLFTEQFGFSKQMMGNIHTVCMSVNGLLILPLGAAIVDRINRRKLFYICLFCSTLHPIIFWSYVRFICPMPVPHIVIGFHVFDAAFDHLGMIALWPLLYEKLVPATRGTAQAGFLIVGGIVSFVVMNLMGAWVKFFSHLFSSNGQYDYMIGYLLILILGLTACGLVLKLEINARSAIMEEGKSS